jgi:putative copper resistance protein D
MTDALIAARLVHFASVMALFGGALFALYAHSGGVAAIVRFLRMQFVLASVLALVSEAGWLATSIANMTGDWTDITDPEVVRSALLETDFGQVWLARMALTLVLLLLSFFRFSAASRGGAGVFALLSAVLLASLALTGHAAAHKGPMGDVHRVVQAIHLLAGGIWLGGLLPLGRVLASARRTHSAAAIGWAGTIVGRFSRVGYWAVGLVLATGIVNSIFLVGSVEGFSATQYGQVLAAKIALVLIMVAIASINRFRWAPRITAAPALQPAAALWRNVMAELALALAVLALVSLLGTLIPAKYHDTGEGGAIRLPFLNQLV